MLSLVPMTTANEIAVLKRPRPPLNMHEQPRDSVAGSGELRAEQHVVGLQPVILLLDALPLREEIIL